MEDYRKKLEEAAHFILEHDHYVVLAHLNPDGDAIGSCLAMGHLLRALNKTFTLVNEGECPSRFTFLPGFDELIDLSRTELNRTFSHVIALDVADEERFGQIGSLFDTNAQMLNIDHHPTNTRFGTINLIRSSAASTTEILYDLVKRCFPQALNQPLALSLYTGLLTDTGGFRYSNTTSSVFQMASDLLTYGVQADLVAELALETITPTHLEVLKSSLQRISFALDNKVAMLSVTAQEMEQIGASKDDVNGLVSYPKNIEGVEVGVLFKEWKRGEVKVSLRSKRYVNVAELAQSFGGGGHAKAAGYTFRGSLDEAKKELIQRLKQIIK